MGNNTNNEYTVTVYDEEILNKVSKIVARVNAKLSSYDLSVDLKITERLEPHVSNPKVYARVWDVTVIAPNAAASGWELVAILKPAPEVGCYTIKTTSKHEIPATHWELDATYCGHCKKNRRRKFSLLLTHPESGSWEQVGSSCVNEFLGGAGDVILKAINAIGRITDVTSDPQPIVAERHYPPEVALAVTIEHLIATKGNFVPSSSDNGETPTWMVVRRLLDHWTETGEIELSEKAETAAAKCSDWFDAWIDDDKRKREYVRNVETAMDNPVNRTGLPYLCSLPMFWKRILKPTPNTNNGRPAIGAGVAFRGEVVFSKESRRRDGRGECCWIVVKTDQGNLLTTEAHHKAFVRGDQIKGHGTVCAYRTYRDKPQMQLNATGLWLVAAA